MRRLFLAAAVVLASLAGCNTSAPSTLPGGAPAPSDFPALPEVRSARGVATVHLVAAIDPATSLPSFFYEGRAGVAPTVRVNPGDTMVFDVTDELPYRLKMASSINLHFHGLTVSPNAPADDVITMLAAPGGHLHYVVPIPSSQQPGLYWYHPHVHGQTDFQVGDAGMSGAIVVEGLQRHVPLLARIPERILIVRDVANAGANLMPATMMEPAAHSHGANAPCGPDPAPLHITVNNVVQPSIPVVAGQPVFVRLINATGHRNLDLHVDGSPMQVVAIDGYAIDAAAGEPASLSVEHFVVAPAGRVEFVVTPSASTELRSLCFDSGPIGDPDPETVLARLTAAPGERRSDAQPPALHAGAPLPPGTVTQPLPSPAASRVVNLTETPTTYFINGVTYRPESKPMFVVHTGTVEEWTVNNLTGEVHDFHVHQVHFMVQSVNGTPVAHPVWSDTAVVPVRTRQPDGSWRPGTIRVVVDFRSRVIRGTFLFHCHILDHEDGGMMAKLQAI